MKIRIDLFFHGIVHTYDSAHGSSQQTAARDPAESSGPPVAYKIKQ